MNIDEAHEKIHEAGAAHGSRGIAILISILAASLAICQMGGKNAQHISLAANIEASNLWAFFQAKTVRQTVLRTAADQFDAIGPEAIPDRADAMRIKTERWRATFDRYETEPSTQEGRVELAARAKTAEAVRDKALSAYHLFEYGSAAFELGIVLASASVITAVIALAWAAGALGIVGALLCALGWFAPTLVHL
jgi:hypothetical protein